MKNILIFILLVAFSLVTERAYAEKAMTIDELVEMYDITPCAGCHEEKHSEWKGSTMGNSVIDLRVLRGLRTFIKLELDEEETLNRKDLTICISCHVPHIQDASEELVEYIAELVVTAVEDTETGKREVAKEELSKLNLNCLGCHNLKALGFDKTPEKGVIYTPNDVDGSYHSAAGYKTVTSPFMKTSDFCAQCHHCPPSVPWEDCPTLHLFLGPENADFLKSALTISLKARQTKLINTAEGAYIPALVIETSLRNNAGHVIPHG
jgi:cytochrome c553